MPRVVWSDEADAQLADVESDEVFEELLALAGGLSTFPDRGRRVPELRETHAYDAVREIIRPQAARLFYLFIPESDEVVVLGFLLKGRNFTWKVLRRYFSRDE